MCSPPHNTFCRLCTDKDPQQQLRSHMRTTFLSQNSNNSLLSFQTSWTADKKCGCCTAVNVAPPNLLVPFAATKFKMSWYFSKIGKLSHFKHLIDFLWCIEAFTVQFDPVFDELMSFTDPSGLICISHNIVGLCNTRTHSLVFSDEPNDTQTTNLPARSDPVYCWSHSYYSGSKYYSIWWL